MGLPQKPTDLERKGRFVMDVDFIFRIAAIGIIVAVLNQVLIRSGREEQAMLMMLINQIANLFDTIKSVFGL